MIHLTTSPWHFCWLPDIPPGSLAHWVKLPPFASPWLGPPSNRRTPRPAFHRPRVAVSQVSTQGRGINGSRFAQQKSVGDLILRCSGCIFFPLMPRIFMNNWKNEWSWSALQNSKMVHTAYSNQLLYQGMMPGQSLLECFFSRGSFASSTFQCWWERGAPNFTTICRGDFSNLTSVLWRYPSNRGLLTKRLTPHSSFIPEVMWKTSTITRWTGPFHAHSFSCFKHWYTTMS